MKMKGINMVNKCVKRFLPFYLFTFLHHQFLKLPPAPPGGAL